MERNLNALLVLILSGVLWAAFSVQLFKHEQPCPLCLLQRLGMLGVACGALLNVRFSIRRAHYGVSLFSAIFGAFTALRQISLHVCPGFPIFGTPVWGLSLYTWSFIVLAGSVFYIGILMVIFDKRDDVLKEKQLNWWGALAFLSIFLVAFINIITTLFQCGFGPCADV